MSHIHLPDGILPVWLWVLGYLVTIAAGFVLFRLSRKEEVTKKLPLLGMMAAVMVLGASVEIVPIAYHVNLMVISGILLGPSLIFLAIFVVNVILALFGHGGITVIGLNTLILSIEGILGYLFFRLLWKLWKRLAPAAFLASFLALFLSTVSMIGVVSLGIPHYEALMHQGEGEGIFEFKFFKGDDHPHTPPKEQGEVHLGRFATVVLSLGCLGWILEGIITTFILRYINRLKPDLLRLEPEDR